MQTVVYGIILVLIFFIALSLGVALYYMVSGKKQSPQFVKALTVRITLSLVLFGLLMVAFLMGWISPHGLA